MKLARRPLEREGNYLDGGRRTTQLVRQPFGASMMSLPRKYVEYFAGVGPKEGPLAVEPGSFELWAPEDIACFNESYKVSEYAAGFLVSDPAAS